MGWLGNSIGSWLPFVGDAVATLTGNPELIPLIQGGSRFGTDLANGKGFGTSLGQGLLSGGEAFAGQELAPVLTNAVGFTDPATTGNSLTDLFGQTSGAGSLSGPGTLGGDLSNFTDSSGLSSLYGGTAAPAGDLGNLYNSVNTAAPNTAATAGATSAGDFAGTGSNVSSAAGAVAPGGSGAGGGSLAGFGGSPDSIGAPSLLGSSQGGALQLPTDIGSQGASQSGPIGSLLAGPNTPSTGGFNFNLEGAPVGASSQSIPEQISSGLSGGSGMDLSSLFGGGSSAAGSAGNSAGASALNGLLKGGLGYLLNQPNTSGLNAINSASQQAQAGFAPYQAAGVGAENTLSSLYGDNGTAAQTAAQQGFQSSPGYQFALTQGENALNANNAATGQTLSGNAQEALNNYAQGTASQQYNNYVNQLQNLASGGLSAAGGSGTAGLTGAGAVAQLGQNKANAANTAIGSGLSGLFPSGLSLQQLLQSGTANGAGASGGVGGILSSIFS